MIHRRSVAPARRAFSLIELIATIVILSIISTIASVIILNTADGYLEASVHSRLHTDASIALDRIARELRRVGIDTTASQLAPDIAALTTTSITWDVDDTLTLDGDRLLLTIDNGVAAVLAEHVTAFSIRAYDDDNARLAGTLSGDQCDPIRQLEIDLTLSEAGASESLRARVYIRSMMSGAGEGTGP